MNMKGSLKRTMRTRRSSKALPFLFALLSPVKYLRCRAAGYRACWIFIMSEAFLWVCLTD